MSLIAETSNPLLEQALLAKLQQGGHGLHELGQLAPVAVRMGLLQNSLRPRLRDPQLVLVAADHGLAVEGIHTVQSQPTELQVGELLAGQLPVTRLARQLGLALTVVDAGMAAQLPKLDRLQQRKLAHGTRNARTGMAMSIEQAQAAIRAGIEIGSALPGNVLALAGVGVGSHEAAALVLARLSDTLPRDLLRAGPEMNPELLNHLLAVANATLARHRTVNDAIEVLAAFGGFETAVLAGLMLVAAGKRHLVLVDGMAACAALMVASRISPAVTDYCVFCRSQPHHGVDQALSLFRATAMLDFGLTTTDGAGACLTWPLLRAATALLGDDGAGDSALQPLDAPEAVGYDGAAHSTADLRADLLGAVTRPGLPPSHPLGADDLI